MSEIKALEKLRDKYFQPGYRGEKTLEMIADAIQAEVDERFMELPLDADSVPIRVGDKMKSEIQHGVVTSVNENAFFINHGTVGCNPYKFYHVKPRTLEDVLEDFLAHYDSWEDNSYGANRGIERKELFEQTAAEIRELLGVDA